MVAIFWINLPLLAPPLCLATSSRLNLSQAARWTWISSAFLLICASSARFGLGGGVRYVRASSVIHSDLFAAAPMFGLAFGVAHADGAGTMIPRQLRRRWSRPPPPPALSMGTFVRLSIAAPVYLEKA